MSRRDILGIDEDDYADFMAFMHQATTGCKSCEEQSAYLASTCQIVPKSIQVPQNSVVMQYEVWEADTLPSAAVAIPPTDQKDVDPSSAAGDDWTIAFGDDDTGGEGG